MPKKKAADIIILTVLQQNEPRGSRTVVPGINNLRPETAVFRELRKLEKSHSVLFLQKNPVNSWE